jgi:polyphosphate glucokinase
MKAAPVDLETGELLGPRLRFDTPRPATAENMVPVFHELVDSFDYSGPVGVAFPAIVQHGRIASAANIDHSWIGIDAAALFGSVVGDSVAVINDADAAGLAEIRLGAGRGRHGVVIMLTFGTGIGSGFFVDGRLAPNAELGHLEIDGLDAELAAAASARDREDLSWSQWAARVQRYLDVVVGLFSPSLIIIGGGAAKRSTKWLPMIEIETEIEVARFSNNAGIIGAALWAATAAGSDPA